MEISNLNVNRLVKLMRDCAEKIPNDGDSNGYPSAKSLMIIAAMVIDDCVIGDNKEEVILPVAFTGTNKEASS